MKEERKENEEKGEGSDRWDDLKRKAQSIAGWLEAGEERKQTREWEGEDSNEAAKGEGRLAGESSQNNTWTVISID